MAPHLPSSLPWNTTPTRPGSCEAYFGNGFTRRVDLLRPRSDGGGGFFRCYYSETLASSICEMGRVRLDPARIRMSEGGEELGSVMGRSEEEELPVFEEGALTIDGRVVVGGEFLERYLRRGAVQGHTMRALVESVRAAEDGLDCGQWIEEPTLFVTRFEYANLFHTITDWHVILSPLGYETALFKGLSKIIQCEGASAKEFLEKPNDQKTARLTEFGEMLRAAFDLPVDERQILKPVSGHNVLFIRREDYLAHPRHNGKVESRLSNEQEVYDALKNWAAHYSKCKVNLVNGLFAHMKMKEQLRAIQEASVIIGAHGAGLTHIISATSNTVVLEIISSQYRRPHFALISQWRGLKYHAINLAGSYAESSKVIHELSNIMRNLGC
ncbi:Beta-(1,2)-xylosyltransferase [Acorus calamus]|uniref:Beta-(1,2)-xylosyltransferase n=1 Tax=Acorus calamus TaxID=4465 RepID=A0AAV9DZA8_ACOCL|nr:Beta-(1,2)-xylosyltransferase [Acorus calamus]KAK1306332.1 Beta-(1,2)-xylosyltransferase [Acorus calamus]